MMNKLKVLLLLVLIATTGFLSAQETIKMMQYNLLYYGSYTDWCTSTNNNISDKADNLALIIDHVRPDIFTVNEMDPSSYAVNHLLGNALNVNGVSHYRSAAILNQDDGSLINMLYYDNTKLELLSQSSVTTGLRDINIYELRHRDVVPQVRFRVAVGHLKAGSGNDDAGERAAATSEFMDYWSDQSDKRNVIFSGDFNLYGDYEQAYQNLTDPAQGNIQFVDPVDQEGDWSSNYDYRFYHTQSTHYYDDDCPASGGMDDRFDFILVSDDIMSGENSVMYVNGSYTTLGQDGNRYNGSLINPTNNSLPQDILTAMYNFSDHLPVIAEFEIGEAGIAEHLSGKQFTIDDLITDERSIKFTLKSTEKAIGEIRVYNMLGKALSSQKFAILGQENITLPVPQNGLFVIHICNENGYSESFRIVK